MLKSILHLTSICLHERADFDPTIPWEDEDMRWRKTVWGFESNGLSLCKQYRNHIYEAESEVGPG